MKYILPQIKRQQLKKYTFFVFSKANIPRANITKELTEIKDVEKQNSTKENIDDGKNHIPKSNFNSTTRKLPDDNPVGNELPSKNSQTKSNEQNKTPQLGETVKTSEIKNSKLRKDGIGRSKFKIIDNAVEGKENVEDTKRQNI